MISDPLFSDTLLHFTLDKQAKISCHGPQAMGNIACEGHFPDNVKQNR